MAQHSIVKSQLGTTLAQSIIAGSKFSTAMSPWSVGQFDTTLEDPDTPRSVVTSQVRTEMTQVGMKTTLTLQFGTLMS